MKKILLSLFYSFWYFFAKTWTGGVILICVIPILPSLLLCLIFPNFMLGKNENSTGIAGCFVLISLLLSGYTFKYLSIFNNWLEKEYEKHTK